MQSASHFSLEANYTWATWLPSYRVSPLGRRESRGCQSPWLMQGLWHGLATFFWPKGRGMDWPEWKNWLDSWAYRWSPVFWSNRWPVVRGWFLRWMLLSTISDAGSAVGHRSHQACGWHQLKNRQADSWGKDWRTNLFTPFQWWETSVLRTIRYRLYC